MPGTHNQGPFLQGFPHPTGARLAQGVARFGGTYGTTTETAQPSGLRQPFGLYAPGAGPTEEPPRGVWETGYMLVADFVPAVVGVSVIAAVQTPGAGPIVLQSTNASGGGTPTSPQRTIIRDSQGVTRLRLDCPRIVTVSTGSNDTALTYTVRGFDEYGAPMTEVLPGPNAGTATGQKAFLDVVSITPSGIPGSTVFAGTSRFIGLPFFAPSYSLVDLYQGDVLQPPGANFVAGDRTTATGATKDVRGIYKPTAPDGTTSIQIFQVVPQAANPDITRIYGVPQFSG